MIKDPNNAMERIPHPRDNGVLAVNIINIIKIIIDVSETIAICDRRSSSLEVKALRAILH
jgi:hypothetical protein